MRMTAIGIVIAIVAGIAMQPLFEMMNLFKEAVSLNAALMNSCRVARANSLNASRMRDLEAFINLDSLEDEHGNVITVGLADSFSKAFCQSLELTELAYQRSGSGSENKTLVFQSNDGRFKDITVELNIENGLTYSDIGDTGAFGDTVDHDRLVSVITADMKTPYVFITRWLRDAHQFTPDNEYEITSSKKLIVQIIN